MVSGFLCFIIFNRLKTFGLLNTYNGYAGKKKRTNVRTLNIKNMLFLRARVKRINVKFSIFHSADYVHFKFLSLFLHLEIVPCNLTHFIMDSKNVQIQGEFYLKLLNLPHRRLIVDDSFRRFQTPPQKKVYPSSGCLLLRCRFSVFNHYPCNKCVYCYNFFDL